MRVGEYSRLLRTNRNVRRLWLAQLISEMGDWLYSVSLFSLILQKTGSARMIAFAFILQVLPQTVIAPAAGVLHDRLSRKQLMIIADWARAVVVFCMLFAQAPGMTWLIYVLLFLETLFWALFEPGRSAVIPNIVEKQEDALVANALSSVTWSVSLSLGSGLGGLIAAALGRDAVFVINSLSFIVSALLIRSMHFYEPHMEHAPPLRWRDLANFSPIAEGVTYVRKDARRTATIFVKAGTALLGANWIILPIYGERIFRVGSDPESAGLLGMSLLYCSRGIGAMIGPLTAGRWSGYDEKRQQLGIAFGFALASAGYITVSWAPHIAIACLAVAMGHCGGSIAWVFSTTLLQRYTDDKFRGRVFSAEFAFLMGMLSVVAFIGGSLVDAGLPVRTLALGVGILLLVPGTIWFMAQRVFPR